MIHQRIHAWILAEMYLLWLNFVVDWPPSKKANCVGWWFQINGIRYLDRDLTPVSICQTHQPITQYRLAWAAHKKSKLILFMHLNINLLLHYAVERWRWRRWRWWRQKTKYIRFFSIAYISFGSFFILKSIEIALVWKQRKRTCGATNINGIIYQVKLWMLSNERKIIATEGRIRISNAAHWAFTFAF